jgi:hypothetical protein
MERGRWRSLIRWRADDRPPPAGKPVAIRPRSQEGADYFDSAPPLGSSGVPPSEVSARWAAASTT